MVTVYLMEAAEPTTEAKVLEAKVLEAKVGRGPRYRYGSQYFAICTIDEEHYETE